MPDWQKADARQRLTSNRRAMFERFAQNIETRHCLPRQEVSSGWVGQHRHHHHRSNLDYELGGESVARAVAQLFALAADVMGKTIQESR